jgi:hypothetical protein
VSRSSLQLEADALSVLCTTHQAPADTPCPGGGACMDRYGASPGQWTGWFGQEAECGQADGEIRACVKSYLAAPG